MGDKATPFLSRGATFLQISKNCEITYESLVPTGKTRLGENQRFIKHDSMKSKFKKKGKVFSLEALLWPIGCVEV